MASPRVKVPMKAFRSQPGEVASAGSGHMTVIEFSRSNHGPLCVVDTYNPRIASTIDNARDIVFSPRGYHAVRLHLTWPGYKSVERMSIVNIYTQNGLMTRAELLMIVGKEVGAMLEILSRSPCSSKYAQFRVATGAITMRNVFISSILNTIDDIYQVELEIA